MGKRIKNRKKFTKNILKQMPKTKQLVINGMKLPYLVSENGRIFATNYYNNGWLIELPQFDRKGYRVVNIAIDKKIKIFLVHRLVATMFLENPNNLPDVNHLDGNKSNNDVSNLEWCTKSDNRLHAIRNGLVTFHKGDEHHFSTITEDQAISICKMLEENLLTLTEIAEANHTTRGVVYSIKYGDSWKHISENYNVSNHNIQKRSKPKRKKSVKRISKGTVIKICEDLQSSELSLLEICEKYDVSKTKVEAILYNVSWTDITKDYDFHHRYKNTSKHHTKG